MCNINVHFVEDKTPSLRLHVVVDLHVRIITDYLPVYICHCANHPPETVYDRIFFTMADTLSFEQWVTKAELTTDTVKLLEDNGFCSLKSCKLLNQVIIQKNFQKPSFITSTIS